MEIVSVATPGPPLVMMNETSKSLNASTERITRAMAITPFIRGRMMRTNFCRQLAPSSVAALS